MGDIDSSTLWMVVFGAIALVGSIALNVQIYKMTVIDAKARGLKHPKFWGLFNLEGISGSGNVIFYLIGRHRFPIQQMNERDKMEIAARKKNAGIALIFIVLGTIGFLFFFLENGTHASL